jgi:tight adherence protein C
MVLFGIIAFVVVTLSGSVGFFVYTVLYPEQTAVNRLERLTAAAGQAEEARNYQQDVVVEQMMARLGRLAQAEEEDTSTAEIKQLLVQAGYRSRNAMEIYQGIRVAATLGLPVLASSTYLIFTTTNTAFCMLLAAAAGFYGSKYGLSNQATARQAAVLRAYPDALDLMVISVESGLNLDQAFTRVAFEMKAVSPAISEEFSLVNTEISAGIDRALALRHLQERTGLDEVRSLVNTLQQAERYGTSIAQSLRLYSQLGRERRMARAEEKAGQASSKLTVVMIAFLLPVLMAVLMGPSFIRIFVMD